MINQETAGMLQTQMNSALFAAYHYMAFANFYEEKQMPGFARRQMAQSAKASEFAMKIREFLIQEGQQVSFSGITAPKNDFSDIKAPLRVGLEQEQKFASAAQQIHERALALKDRRTADFTAWMVKEQGEKERLARELLDRFKRVGGSSGGGFQILDSELAADG